jgi:hypothetical protein
MPSPKGSFSPHWPRARWQKRGDDMSRLDLDDPFYDDEAAFEVYQQECDREQRRIERVIEAERRYRRVLMGRFASAVRTHARRAKAPPAWKVQPFEAGAVANRSTNLKRKVNHCTH